MYMYVESYLQRCGYSSPCVCACTCAHKGWMSTTGKGAQGNAAGMSGSWVPPVCSSVPTDPAIQQHPSKSRLRACGCARPKRSLPAVGTHACAWESQQPCHRPARETSRICVGPITKRGQYLQAGPCSSISELCREKERGGCISLGHGSAALPLPSHGCISPGQDTCFLLAKLKKPLQLQPPDKV